MRDNHGHDAKGTEKAEPGELLDRWLEEKKRAEKLAEENARLKERITERERQLAQAGAMAETAYKLSKLV